MKPPFTYPLAVNEQNRALVESIRAAAEKLLDEPILSCSYSNFVLFDQTGSRVEYEEEYMAHRKMLCAFGTMALLGEDGKWIGKLSDVIWAICDEFTWALPAHLTRERTSLDRVERIDLFASETAFALSELSAVLGDRLPEAVLDRVSYELERRIIGPYTRRRPTYPKSNWSAVCMSGIVASLVYLDRRADFDALIGDIRASIDVFLSSYYDDGCCMEGMLYWEYGFGFFCYTAELLYRYTDGRINYFADEKVKKIAFFGQNCYFRANNVVSFADSPHDSKHSIGLWALLAAHFDGIIAPPARYAALFGGDIRYRFPTLIRSLYAPNLKTSDAEDRRLVYYPDAKWYIHKGHGYIFAAKAGHNEEPHNHNDIGAFELYDGGDYIIDDPGWASYYKEYFGPNRYRNPNTASRGHAVPMIDGGEQISGEDACGEVLAATDDTFVLSYAAAYGNPKLERLCRTFRLFENGITVEDRAEGTHGSLVSRFTTRIEPKLVDGGVRIRDYLLSSDTDAEISVSSFRFMPRFMEFKDWSGGEETVWCIDFALKDPRGAVFTIVKESM